MKKRLGYGDIIKHERFLDVCIFIEKGIIVTPNSYIIRGQWFNQGFVNTSSIGTKARFKIPKARVNEWFYCLEPLAKCIRNKKWEQI